ncbi:hypothetical protein NDJ78_11360 [Vibrio parahaemolyticus]|uniref:AbaSI family restriction endonuclease n=1 Tax=Vibrio harveyi group TaxID=717610 RepID=UPI00215E59CB|nr:hypothetical protein [Vibrio parahaemolyticus]ELA9413387.1 hypothetical protein [Vibrio parahaemolyticus]MCS0190788.1 hypothetical protein [Vibrio parahaemolyticus]
MSLTKTEYILRSIRKLNNKGWEFFIVTRIIHALPDDIEFVTQQLVRLQNGKRALTDLYFPQFDIHLEIDEKHHERQRDKDFKREMDIVRVTKHSIVRIQTPDTKQEHALKIVCAEVDAFINKLLKLRGMKVSKGEFCPWDFESRYSAESVIKAGVVSVKGNIVFRKQLEALRCFGFQGSAYQRGAWQIPDGSNDMIWFPRLYKHGIWHNEITSDGTRIVERAFEGNQAAVDSIKKQKELEMKFGGRNAIVFAKAKDSLGFNLYRYVGTFRMNLSKSTNTEIVFDRVSDEEKIRTLD